MIRDTAANLLASIIADTDPEHFEDDLEYIAYVNSLLDMATDISIDLELVLLRIKELRYAKIAKPTE